MLKLLGVFASGCVGILGLTLALVRRHNPTLPSREKAAILWFVLCKFAGIQVREVQSLTQCLIAAGTIHLFFEGRTLLDNAELFDG